jgi:hypothetical protein
LTLRRWTSARIAEAFGVWEDNTVRLWKAQAEAGDITLLFADESEAPDPSLSCPHLGQTRREPSRPCAVTGQKIALRWARWITLRRELILTTARTKRSADFIEHHRLSTAPSRTPSNPAVLVLNNSLIHISKASRAALAERAVGSPSNGCPDMRLNWMTTRPSAATLKSRYLAHQTFTDLDPPRVRHPSRSSPSSSHTESGIRWPRKESLRAGSRRVGSAERSRVLCCPAHQARN